MRWCCCRWASVWSRFDRFLVLPMYPVIMRDLHLDYADLGRITGALAIAWGISAFIVGRWLDRIGRRRMLVGAMIALPIGAKDR